MFKTKNPQAATTPTTVETPKSGRSAPRPTGVPSIISAEMTLHGDLHSNGDLQIDGNVVGDIEVAKLVISSGGSVAGNIIANDVRICGAMTGTIRGAMVTLTASARVTGDIYHELLAIETGGQLDGQARRLVAPAPEAAITPQLEHHQDNAHAPDYPNGHAHEHQHEHQNQHGGY